MKTKINDLRPIFTKYLSGEQIKKYFTETDLAIVVEVFNQIINVYQNWPCKYVWNTTPDPDTDSNLQPLVDLWFKQQIPALKKLVTITTELLKKDAFFTFENTKSKSISNSDAGQSYVGDDIDNDITRSDANNTTQFIDTDKIGMYDFLSDSTKPLYEEIKKSFLNKYVLVVV